MSDDELAQLREAIKRAHRGVETAADGLSEAVEEMDWQRVRQTIELLRFHQAALKVRT